MRLALATCSSSVSFSSRSTLFFNGIVPGRFEKRVVTRERRQSGDVLLESSDQSEKFVTFISSSPSSLQLPAPAIFCTKILGSKPTMHKSLGCVFGIVPESSRHETLINACNHDNRLFGFYIVSGFRKPDGSGACHPSCPKLGDRALAEAQDATNFSRDLLCGVWPAQNDCCHSMCCFLGMQNGLQDLNLLLINYCHGIEGAFGISYDLGSLHSNLFVSTAIDQRAVS